MGGAGGTREDTGGEDRYGGGFKIDGERRKDLGDSVSRARPEGRGGRRGTGAGASGARGGEPVGRLSGGSGDALVIV